MEHPNAHALRPASSTRSYRRLPGLGRTALVIAGCAAVALAATPLLAHGVGTPAAGELLSVDPTAAQVTALGPHVVVYSVPTKKGKGGGSKHHKNSGGDSGSGDSDSGKGSGDSDSSKSGDSTSSGDSGDSGSSSSSSSGDSSSSGSGDAGSSGSSGSEDTSVSNTVNGTEVGGAQTYNNHTTTPSGTGDTSSSSSPVQLKDNTGAGTAGLNSLNAQGSDGVAGTTGLATTNSGSGAVSAAPAVMLMRVSCPASVASGTVCLQVTSVGGATAASLPTNSSSAPLPISTSPSAASLPSTSTLSTGSPTSALGQTVDGGHVDVSALESRSGKKIELTGYSFQDNQGGNNATISCPIIHKKAGGTGTYQDPITVASGGKSGGASADGIKCGDRFYLPAVQRYVIVEDTGNTPNKSMPHLDMYVGDDPNKSCMNKISGTVTAIAHPPSGLPVLAGPIGSNGSCKLPDSGSAGGGK